MNLSQREEGLIESGTADSITLPKSDVCQLSLSLSLPPRIPPRKSPVYRNQLVADIIYVVVSQLFMYGGVYV